MGEWKEERLSESGQGKIAKSYLKSRRQVILKVSLRIYRSPGDLKIVSFREKKFF